MKKEFIYLFMILIFGSCYKEEKTNNDALNVTCITADSNAEIVNVKLKSGTTHYSSIDCYVFASTVIDPNTSGFGYVDCNSNFVIINPQTGEKINEFELSGFLSQTIVDADENTLVGQYYENELNYVVKIDLSNGETIAKNVVDFGEGIFACSYFYDSSTKEYILLKADTTLIFINPENGNVNKTVEIASFIDNVIYDMPKKRIIGISYSPETDMNYLKVININTGELLSNVDIKERNDYYGCVSGFDSELNSYIIVNPENEILFIDIESGEIKDSFTIDFDIKEFKFWRSNNHF